MFTADGVIAVVTWTSLGNEEHYLCQTEEQLDRAIATLASLQNVRGFRVYECVELAAEEWKARAGA